jgi:hypothetical protein
MRSALSLFATSVVMLVSATATAAPDAGTDSGIMTAPSPSNPTIPLDSGTADATTLQPPESALGLVTAASILVMSRRRRGGR